MADFRITAKQFERLVKRIGDLEEDNKALRKAREKSEKSEKPEKETPEKAEKEKPENPEKAEKPSLFSWMRKKK